MKLVMERYRYSVRDIMTTKPVCQKKWWLGLECQTGVIWGSISIDGGE